MIDVQRHGFMGTDRVSARAAEESREGFLGKDALS